MDGFLVTKIGDFGYASFVVKVWESHALEDVLFFGLRKMYIYITIYIYICLLLMPLFALGSQWRNEISRLFFLPAMLHRKGRQNLPVVVSFKVVSTCNL